MQQVVVVCEGQTEEQFIKRVLSPALIASGILLEPQTIQTSIGKKGGALNYQRVQRHVLNLLRYRAGIVVTTFFDLYALDNSFQKFEETRVISDARAKATALNKAFREDLQSKFDFDGKRFIPHIQPHEFEALLFSDVNQIVAQNQGWASAQAALNKALHDASNLPEYINHRPGEHPSALLQQHLDRPRYSKVLDGIQIAEEIGLAKIENKCPTFSQWLNSLRNLSA